MNIKVNHEEIEKLLENATPEVRDFFDNVLGKLIKDKLAPIDYIKSWADGFVPDCALDKLISTIVATTISMVGNRTEKQLKEYKKKGKKFLGKQAGEIAVAALKEIIFDLESQMNCQCTIKDCECGNNISLQ